MPARSALRAAAVTLIGGLAASALAGCSVDIGTLQHRTVSYRVPGPVQALVVHAHVGNVRVTGGNGAGITVTEHLAYRRTAPVTTHRSAAGTLTLGSHCPALETCGVGYDITVPRAARVQIGDGAGTIRVQSLSGQVTAHTGAGNIDLRSLSGTLGASSGAGSVTGQDVSSGHVTLHVAAGRIDVTFSAAPASVTATDTAGSVTLRLPGSADYAVTARVSVGSARISVPRSASSPHIIMVTITTGSATIEPAP